MKCKKILAGVLTAAMVLTGIPSSGLALQAQAEGAADFTAVLYSNVPTYTRTYTDTAAYTAESGLPAVARPEITVTGEGVSGALTGKRLLQNHTSNSGNTLSAFNTATDSSLDFSKAEMVITSTDTANRYTVYNEASGLYFINNGNSGLFQTGSCSVYIKPVSGADAFTVSNNESEYYTIFYLDQMNFNRMSGTDDNTSRFIYNLTFLEKQDSISEDDILPGYRAVSAITSGKTYLITHIYDSRVIVLYANRATSTYNEVTKLLGTDIEKTFTITADPTVLTADTTATVTADGSTYTVQYHAAEQYFYNEKDFWDVQLAEGKLADQTADDAWHYQLQGADNKWTDLPPNAYYPNALTEDDDTPAAWMTDGTNRHNTYHWAKLSRSQITSTLLESSGLQGVAYAYKVPKDGYYLATLEGPMSNTDGSKLAISVTHAASDMTAADGRTLLAETEVGNGGTFTSKIAKAKVGDYIRISAAKKNAWAKNFCPMIVPCTASQYAAQYAEEIQAFVDAGAYTEATKSRVTEKLAALNSLIDENASAAETEIDAAIAALELAATGAGRDAVSSTTAAEVADGNLTLRYDNPTVGSPLTIDTTAENLFASANSLTVDVLFKATSAVTTAVPLVTVSDRQGGYLTFLFNPNGGICTLASGTAGTGCPSGFNFSRPATNGWKVNDGEWHRLAMSISKDGYFYVSMDGGTNGANGGDALRYDTANWENQNSQKIWKPIASLLTDHDWEVSELLLGQPATSGDYSSSSNASSTNGVGSTAALTAESGLTVRYLEISSAYHTTDETNVAPNSLAVKSAGDDIAEELGTVIKEADQLAKADYTTATWETFQTALTAAKALVTVADDGTVTANEAARDWTIYNAIDALRTAIAELEQGYFTGTSVTLDGNIGLNFYTEKTAADNVTVTFTKADGTEVDAQMKEGTTQDSEGNVTSIQYYTFELPAKEMADTVTATMYDADGNEISTANWSVKAYAEKLLGLGDYAEAGALTEKAEEIALVKAMLNYGAAAQTQFNHNTGTLANSILDSGDQTVDEIGTSLNDVCGGQGLNGTSYNGFSLVLKSETALKLYFDAGTQVTITDKNGNQLGENDYVTASDDSEVYYKIENIAAHELGDEYTVSVGEDVLGTVSALTYCYKVSQNVNASDSLKNVVNALYGYYTAAKTYQDFLTSTTE